MSIGRILFLALFLLSSSTILAVSSVVEEITFETIDYWNESSNIASDMRQAELKENYKEELNELFSNYDGSEDFFVNLEQDLLLLTTPSDYKDLHFKLVTAIAELNGNDSSADKVKARLQKLSETYSWLAGHMSFFIANSL